LIYSLYRPVNYDSGPGGMWEIIPAVGCSRRDAEDLWHSYMEQVRTSGALDSVGHFRPIHTKDDTCNDNYKVVIIILII